MAEWANSQFFSLFLLHAKDLSIFFCIFALEFTIESGDSFDSSKYIVYVLNIQILVNSMIEFETKNVELPMLDFGKIDRWLGLVAASHGKTIGNVNYLFVMTKRFCE